MKPLRLYVVPVILLIVGSAMALKMFPLYSGGGIYNSDPSYAYLFNGLLLLDGHSPHHKDHPGTPLQILIAAIVYLQWGYYKLTSVVEPDVIVAAMAQPERYLLLISRVLLVLNVAATVFIGKRVFDATKSYYLAILCQCSLLTYGLFGTKLMYPAPEALVAFLSLCLLAVFIPRLFDRTDDSKPQTKTAILAGIIFGVGFATKLTFLPMVGLFLLFKRPSDIALALFATLAAWLMAVAPILKKLLGLWEWVYNMATHTGKYGSGSKGLVDTSQVLGNLKALIQAFPFFYLVIALFAGYLIYAGFKRFQSSAEVQRQASNCDRAILVFLLICCAQTLLVLKHFGQHYMLPVLPMAFVGTALLLNKLNDRQTNWAVWLKWLVGLFVAYLVVQSNYSAFATLKAERVANNRSVNQITAEIAKYPNALTISSYGCYLRQCGLMFGIEYAPAIDKKIKPFLPNFYGFNIWNSMLLIDGHGFYPLTVLQPFLAENRPIFFSDAKRFSCF